MTTAKKKLMTADELLRLYSQGVRGELIYGVFCATMPAGGEHGKVALLTGHRLMNVVVPQRLGTVVGTDAGVLLHNGPDLVREPAVAFFSAEKLPLDAVVPGYFDVAPDLVVEIESPSDSELAVYDKCRMWLSHGVPLVWHISPPARMVRVHRQGLSVLALTEDDTLDGGDIIPGFTCLVRDLFDY